MPNEERQSAMGFLGYAERYLKAAEGMVPEWRSAIDGKRDPFGDTYPVCDYLAGRAIELALKAYLLGSGMEVQELKRRPYNHDLAALKEEAVRREIEEHVRLEAEHHGVIALLAGPYSNKELEYQGEGEALKTAVERGLLIGTADKLVRGLDSFCRKATLAAFAARREAVVPQEGKS